MDYAAAKSCVLRIIREDSVLKDVFDSLQNPDDVKFSDYLDSLDFMVLDYKLLSNFPQYQSEKPFTRENCLRDVCNFVATVSQSKKPLE